MKVHAITFLIVNLLCHLGHGQTVTGDWHGLLPLTNQQVRLTLHLERSDNGYTGTADSPEEDRYGLPLEDLRISDQKISFKLEDTEFTGKLYAASSAIDGAFMLNDKAVPLTFGRDSIAAPANSIVHVKAQYNKAEYAIPMRDGKKLFTSVYTPKDTAQTYPIIIWRTPYNSEPSEEEYTNRLTYNTHLLEEGYIMVFQDVRGRFMSEGEFVDVRPYRPNKKKSEVDENSDTFDTIDWLIKNVKNNNGKVGIYGISYPGFYASMALPQAHPALKAASPQAPVSDWFIGDDWHHNGAFFLMDAFSFYSFVGRPRPEPTRDFPTPFQFQNEDNYDFFMDLGTVKNVSKQYFGDTIQFWSDLMSHPNYDDFWKERNVLPHLKNVKPAVLVVGGWFDAEDLYGPLNTYEAIETQNKENNQNRLIMGPWYHGQWSSAAGEKLGNIHFDANTSEYFKEVELKFFNYYLKDKGNMDLPEATIFLTGANAWKAFDTWPPLNVEKRNMYLHADQTLSFTAPTATESFDEYISDPDKPVPYTEDVHLSRTREYLTDDQRFASRRPDVMVYQTDTLTEDITLTGPIQVNFFVSTTGTDADYVVKLIDVFPDQINDYPENEKGVPMGGYQMLVRGEVLRGKYRDSFENPQPFVPGEVTEVTFEVPDVAHTFKKGHRIMIQVQNSWFPLVDRNPQQFLNIYECEEADFIKATHRIYHDGQRPSHLIVPVLNSTEGR